MTAQGHPRTIFRRALDRGNLLVAETVAREIGRVALSEALELTALIAQKDARRKSRAAVRFLERLLDERRLTIEEASLAASALAALGGPGHDAAVSLLMGLAAEQTGRAAYGRSA